MLQWTSCDACFISTTQVCVLIEGKTSEVSEWIHKRNTQKVYTKIAMFFHLHFAFQQTFHCGNISLVPLCFCSWCRNGADWVFLFLFFFVPPMNVFIVLSGWFSYMEVFGNLYSIDVILCLHWMQFLFPLDLIHNVYCNKHKLANSILKANFADVRKLIENYNPGLNNFRGYMLLLDIRRRISCPRESDENSTICKFGLIHKHRT